MAEDRGLLQQTIEQTRDELQRKQDLVAELEVRLTTASSLGSTIDSTLTSTAPTQPSEALRVPDAPSQPSHPSQDEPMKDISSNDATRSMDEIPETQIDDAAHVLPIETSPERMGSPKRTFVPLPRIVIPTQPEFEDPLMHQWERGLPQNHQSMAWLKRAKSEMSQKRKSLDPVPDATSAAKKQKVELDRVEIIDIPESPPLHGGMTAHADDVPSPPSRSAKPSKSPFSH